MIMPAAAAAAQSQRTVRRSSLSGRQESFSDLPKTLLTPLGLSFSKCQSPSSRSSLATTAPSSRSPRLPSSATSCCMTAPTTSANTFLNIIPESVLKLKLRRPRASLQAPRLTGQVQLLQNLTFWESNHRKPAFIILRPSPRPELPRMPSYLLQLQRVQTLLQFLLFLMCLLFAMPLSALPVALPPQGESSIRL